MIFCNGVPKSGTHALLKCLGLLGLNRVPGMARAYGTNQVIRFKKTRADPVPLDGKAMDDWDNRAFLHAHMNSGYDFPGHLIVNIRRDPRNVVISYVRDHRHQALHDKEVRGERARLLHVLAGPYYFDRTIKQIFGDFVGWLQRKDCLNISFEDLIADGGDTVRAICAYIDTEPRPEAYRDLIGLRGNYQIYEHGQVDLNTWSGALTDWRHWWDAKIDRAWTKAGGPEIEKAWGYGHDRDWQGDD